MTNATKNATITPAMRAADVTICKTAGTHYGKVRPIFERYIVANDDKTLSNCAAAFYGDDEGRLPSLRATLSALAKKHGVKISVSIKKGFALTMKAVEPDPEPVAPESVADDAATQAAEMDAGKARAIAALDAIRDQFGADFIADYIAAAMMKSA